MMSKISPNFVAVYFEESVVHTWYHEGWCDLPEAVQRVDKTSGLIVEGLKQHELLNKVNKIITADHGIATPHATK